LPHRVLGELTTASAMEPTNRSRTIRQAWRLRNRDPHPAAGIVTGGGFVCHLTLRACDRTFLIRCDDDEAVAFVQAAFSDLLVSPSSSSADAIILCRIFRARSGCRFRVLDSGGGAASFDDIDGLVFHIDKLLTIALQYQRPDLYFLHAAAVALDGRVAVLVAPSGTGKSTLALALVDSGFSYLSDELAPLDFRTMTVHPYAHALCLKSPPPQPYRLPPGTLDTGGRFHIPVAALSAATVKEPLPLAAIVFIQRRQPAPVVCRSITPARAAARLMANALNPLAHDGDGLDVAVTISQTVPCFELESGDLHRACAAIETILCQGDGVRAVSN
jgi:hypothetical protein